jgi:hypothetical protein
MLVACGARSTLDEPVDEPTGTWPEGTGGWIVDTSSGGNLGSGGWLFGSGGASFGTGGIRGTGGVRNTGGSINLGGVAGMSRGGAMAGGGGSTGGQAGFTIPANTGGRAGAGGSGAVAGSAGRPSGGAGGSAGVIGGGSGPNVGGAGAALGAGGVAGGGGFGAIGGSTATGGITTCPDPAPNLEMIDDLNDGDRFIPPINGRAGAWSSSHDDSPGASMFPDPSTGFSPTKTDDACRKYAVYVAGDGYVLWGANVWFGLGSPYDASKYTGITFLAKIDSGASKTMRVAFPDKDTQPEGAICDPGVSSGATACYDHYGKQVTLSTTWEPITVRFDEVKQANWGHQGDGFDPSSIYQVLFQIPVGAKFRIWIDDVAFTL